MSNVYVWKIELGKWGSDEILKTIHMIGLNLFEITHIATHYIYEESEELSNAHIEILSVTKVRGIETIVNGEYYSTGEDEDIDSYTGKEPLDLAENMPDERVISFTCACYEKLRVADGNWPFLICPNCETRILRREIVNTGGIYLYIPLDKKK
jgi:hypothetical protein